MKSSDIPYNSYSTFLKETFGQRVQKVAVNAGFTCPNRDGKVAYGGCTYCNIDSFTPEAARARIPIRDQVRSGINIKKIPNFAFTWLWGEEWFLGLVVLDWYFQNQLGPS